jgi:hypothetical protein
LSAPLSTDSPSRQVMEYAGPGPGLVRRSLLLVTIGIVSICVACLTFLVSGYYEFIAYQLGSSSIAQLQAYNASTDLSATDEKAAGIFASIVISRGSCLGCAASDRLIPAVERRPSRNLAS